MRPGPPGATLPAETGDAMAGPLNGVRVLDLTGTVLGPMGTQHLGDAGADVVKVEAPEGDSIRYVGPRRSHDMAAYFVNLNRNKRSVVLNLKQPAARAALERMIARADVLVHNMRPSAAARLGVDYASLAPKYPRLIHASASGFRLGSTRAEQPAYDDLIQGMCGLAALNGEATGADGPRYVPTVMADKITGTMLAMNIGFALYARERSGLGQSLHIPMMDTMLAFLLPEHLWGYSIAEPDQGIGYPRMMIPDRRPFATADGHLCLIAVTDAQWRRLFAVFGRPEIAADPRFATTTARGENVGALYAEVAASLRTRTTAAWLDALADADIPHGAANTLLDLTHDDYVREIGFFRDIQHPTEGPMITLAPAADYSATPAAITRHAPRLGEHTAEVLREAGLTPAEIAEATA